MTYFDDFAANFARANATNAHTNNNPHENTAAQFVAAIKTIATKPENLDNFENYLSYHFDEWLRKFANTPETITAELHEFANMII